jgi:hypothetical protein
MRDVIATFLLLYFRCGRLPQLSGMSVDTLKTILQQLQSPVNSRYRCSAGTPARPPTTFRASTPLPATAHLLSPQVPRSTRRLSLATGEGVVDPKEELRFTFLADELAKTRCQLASANERVAELELEVHALQCENEALQDKLQHEATMRSSPTPQPSSWCLITDVIEPSGSADEAPDEDTDSPADVGSKDMTCEPSADAGPRSPVFHSPPADATSIYLPRKQRRGASTLSSPAFHTPDQFAWTATILRPLSNGVEPGQRPVTKTTAAASRRRLQTFEALQL